jgi:hypothetical protein
MIISRGLYGTFVIRKTNHAQVDLFLGPDPLQYTRLRTWDMVLDEAYSENAFRIRMGKPTFVGVMPQRVDLPVLPAADPPTGLFVNWEKGLNLTIRTVNPTWWGILLYRIKGVLGFNPPPTGFQLIERRICRAMAVPPEMF